MRVFSPPLRPQMIDGRAYVLIDMGADGGWLGPKRTGLTKLYGRELSVERRLVGFARDISLVSEAEYEALAPPSRVEGFTPARSNPLRNPDLEYSGMYEDGWLSPETYFRLTQPAGADEAAVKINVPDGLAPDFHTDLTLTVDGAEVWKGTLGPGEFALRRPVPSSAASRVRELRLRFSRPLHLPAPDGRPVGAILVSAGFEAKPAPPSRIEGFTPDDHNPLRHGNLPHAGIDEDGWVASDGYVRLTQPPGADQIMIKGVVPGGLTPDFKTELTVLVDSQEVWRETIGPGEFTIRRPAPSRGSAESRGPREVRLRFSATQRLPAPDARAVGARMYMVGFEPAAGR
jgi:hypothetical protein